MKLGIKSIFSVALSVSLVFGAAGSTFAHSGEEPQISTSSTEKLLYTADGELIGSVKKESEITITNKGYETSFSVTDHNDYKLENKFSDIPEYQKRFADGTETNTYVIKDNKVYKDGEVLIDPSSNPISIMNDTGGIPFISHYYSTSNLKSYTFKTYSDVKFNTFDTEYFMSPAGDNITKTTTPSNSLFYAAKGAVDSFENDNDDYVVAIGSFLTAAGTLGLTWETIIGAITAGGAAATAAILVVDKFGDCKEDVSDAYMYVSNF